MAINLQSYRFGLYIIVVGGNGKANVHFGNATGPLLHTADSLGNAMVWVEDARRDDVEPSDDW